MLLCLGAHAQARYTVVCVCVCVCVCVRAYVRGVRAYVTAAQGSMKSFYRLLVMLSWISIRGFAK